MAFQGKVKITGRDLQDYYTIIMTNEFGEEVKRIHGVHETDLVVLLRANIDGSDSWKHIKEEYYSQLVLK